MTHPVNTVGQWLQNRSRKQHGIQAEHCRGSGSVSNSLILNCHQVKAVTQVHATALPDFSASYSLLDHLLLYPHHPSVYKTTIIQVDSQLVKYLLQQRSPLCFVYFFVFLFFSSPVSLVSPSHYLYPCVLLSFSCLEMYTLTAYHFLHTLCE